ncbi:MAG: phenylacetic acid degradation bifunctional protein PaaZ [Candidatus Eremiobacteraeota bacterium]|nr:phenylacetic acid degradation bifunctional protein PaaZ [Candidatus Eremiobacteraeota bacterium]
MIASEPALLESYLGGRWVAGTGAPADLVDPVRGEVLARTSSAGLDLGFALAFAREVGRPALGALDFAQRAALLGAIADVLAARRDDWYAISRRNSGNTRADAAIDVDGAIGTLKYYAKLGATLGSATLLLDGAPARLARDANFQGVHLGIPLPGLAIHINAFNFPAWGLWEKAAVALLAGVPVLAKPATATALLAVEMTRAVSDAGILPPGALSLLVGSAGELLDYLRFGDAIAFTGSARTAEAIRSHPRVRAEGVRLNVEADSLNAALLGPDGLPGTPIFGAFVREVVREMTSKAGQKCTAIRRVIVPAVHVDAVVAAISEGLDAIAVGDPSDEGVGMGPLVSREQRAAVEDGIRSLSDVAAIVYRGEKPANGAFVPPTLLRAPADAALVHIKEIFGPVATVVPYKDAADAFVLARRGGGSLVVSVFSADAEFLIASAAELGSSHGRVLLVDPSIADAHTGHGIVLPSCVHGGPGRAGGGEELGGLRGLWFYHQRTAVQGSAPVVAALAARGASITG